jgi:hypothetical protein
VEFVDALSAQSTSKCDVHVDVLPTKLRPVKIEDENLMTLKYLRNRRKI